MKKNGEKIWLTGNGMASERACILVQKLSDGHGFIWYRRLAYYDLLPEMGATEFPADIGKSCFDGSVLRRRLSNQAKPPPTAPP